MSIWSLWKSARWVRGTFVVALVCAAALAAYGLGWLPARPWTGHARLATHSSELDDEDVPGPVDPDDFELPVETMLAQSESDDMAPEPDDGPTLLRSSVRTAGGSGARRMRRDDSVDVPDPARGNSPIQTVGFEEEAPPAPIVPDEPAPRERGSGSADNAAADKPSTNRSAANKAAVAARPVDSAKPASTARGTEAGPTRALPLMDRQKIARLIDDGNYIDAQNELSRWFWQVPAEREKLLSDLNRMAQSLYFSPQPQFYDPYVVKPGDQLRVVGQRYKLSWEYLSKLNRVDARKIRMGQKLKVVPGPFAAIVFLDRYELVVHLNGSFVKSYRVGVGKDGTTPQGTFTVKNKMVDPTYYGPEGVIAHDDPKNPLGERWIDIGDSYGIHGTIDPESIGRNESRGCIRMLNLDVEEVYDFLVIGSEVKIQK